MSAILDAGCQELDTKISSRMAKDAFLVEIPLHQHIHQLVNESSDRDNRVVRLRSLWSELPSQQRSRKRGGCFVMVKWFDEQIFTFA